MDWFITKGVSLKETLYLLILSLPYLLVMTIPMSVLLAVLVTFGRFSHDSEITAMKASGISIHRMMPPVLLFATFAYIITSIVYINALPQTNLMIKQLKYDTLRTKANMGIKPHVFYTDFINLVIYVNEVIHHESRMQGIFIADNRDSEQPLVIVAENCQELLHPDMNYVTLRLANGCTHELFKLDQNRYSMTPFDTMDLTLDMSQFKPASVTKSDREMTISELYEKAKKNEAEGRNSNRQWVEIWKKTSLPFACFVFAVLGVPLGITTKRGGKSGSFASAIGLILIYYILLTGGTGLSEEGRLNPFIATWTPNFLLGIFALLLYLRETNDAPFQWWASVREFITDSIYNLISHYRKKSDHSTSRQTWSFMLGRILDRYISIQFLQFFAYTLMALITISLIVHIFERIDTLVEHNASITDSIIAIGLKMPYFGYLALPFAALVATLLTIGVFTKSSELTAMKASGISYLRVTAPLIILGFLITTIAFFLDESIIPACNRQVEQSWDRIKNRERTRFVRYHRWYRGKSGDLYYFQNYDPEHHRITGFSQFKIDRNMNITYRLEAANMIWENNQWKCINGRIVTIDINQMVLEDKMFDVFFNQIPETPDDFSKEYKESEEMNIRELEEYIAVLKSSGFDTIGYEVDWHSKFSIPFLSFIMVLIGIAFSAQNNRSSGGIVGIGMAIFIGAIYFIVFRIGLELGQASRLSPFLAAWICNFLFLIITSWFLFRVSQHNS